jgi:hypothetical protein
MSSRMFRISRSRLGAHTSRMGDISVGLVDAAGDAVDEWRDLSIFARALSQTRDAVQL